MPCSTLFPCPTTQLMVLEPGAGRWSDINATIMIRDHRSRPVCDVMCGSRHTQQNNLWYWSSLQGLKKNKKYRYNSSHYFVYYTATFISAPPFRVITMSMPTHLSNFDHSRRELNVSIVQRSYPSISIIIMEWE